MIIFYTKFLSTNQLAILDRWLADVPDFLQKTNAKYKLEVDRTRNLLGKILLQKGLLHLGYDTISLNDLDYDNFNRPYLPGKLDFNISHSGEYVVCVIGAGIRVGIDIEQIQEVDFLAMKDMMSCSEWQVVKVSKYPLREFFRYWTMKEAVLKAAGVGFSTNLYQEMTLSNTMIDMDGCTWHVQELDLDKCYCGHLVTSESVNHIRFQYYDYGVDLF